MHNRKIKYAVYPGFVHSQHDGDRHYISAYKLMQLYGVEPRHCHIVEPAPWWSPSMFEYEERFAKGLIALRPQYDGNYTLPEAADA